MTEHFFKIRNREHLVVMAGKIPQYNAPNRLRRHFAEVVIISDK